MRAYRIRDDGTSTYTTPEWDQKWYWPVGTRVVVGGTAAGVVVKQNSTTAHIRLDSGATLQRVRFAALARLSITGGNKE